MFGAGFRFFDFFALGVDFGLDGGDVVEFFFVGGLHAVEQVCSVKEEVVECIWVERVDGTVGEEGCVDVDVR